jgi:hypothetical protein
MLPHVVRFGLLGHCAENDGRRWRSYLIFLENVVIDSMNYIDSFIVIVLRNRKGVGRISRAPLTSDEGISVTSFDGNNYK